MPITAQEMLMYRVMKAIYDSGIPMNFKGSMVLRACLTEAGFAEETRHTVDIDANWNTDTEPSTEQIAQSLQQAMSKCDAGLRINVLRAYDKHRSAGFEITDAATNEILFTMDVDVNRPVPPTKIYEMDGMRFCGVTPMQIIADKIYAISTDAVFRRVKDIVDVYYLSKIILPDKDGILDILKNNGRHLGSFDAFLHSADDLRHAYEKFRFEGSVAKPAFADVYSAVMTYVSAWLPNDR